MTAQLPLNLGHRPALGRDAFLVAASNETAVGWIDRWPDWPVPALVLQGPPGAGKTHLAHVWMARTRAMMIDGAALTPDQVADLLAADHPLVIEAADTAAERPLLHLYNGALERGIALLLTAQEAPARWNCLLPDLASRLRALPVAALLPPDDRLIHALLIKLFADRQITVAAEVPAFLLARMERSFAAARALVTRIDEAALAAHRPVTVPLVRQVLAALEADQD